MKKNTMIRVEGDVRQRRIIKEIIYKHINKGVNSNIDFIKIELDDKNGGKRVECYDYAVDYEFVSSSKIFKKIIRDLEIIGVRLYRNDKRNYRVIMY